MKIVIGDDNQTQGQATGPAIPPLSDLIGIQSSGSTMIGPTISSQPTGGHGVTLTDGGALPSNVAATAIQVLVADPASPVVGQIWYRSDLSKLCIRHNSTTTKTVVLA